jgi:hypothetical protein
MSRPSGLIAALLLAGTVVLTSGCVFVPVGRPVVAEPVVPAVVVPAPVVVAPGPPVYGGYRGYYGYRRSYGRYW